MRRIKISLELLKNKFSLALFGKEIREIRKGKNLNWLLDLEIFSDFLRQDGITFQFPKVLNKLLQSRENNELIKKK